MTDQELEEFKSNLPNASNIKLCEVIVVYKYLGTSKEESLICMAELASRRVKGDSFEYEKYIDDTLKTLPKFDIDIQKLFKIPKV